MTNWTGVQFVHSVEWMQKSQKTFSTSARQRLKKLIWFPATVNWWKQGTVKRWWITLRVAPSKLLQEYPHLFLQPLRRKTEILAWPLTRSANFPFSSASNEKALRSLFFFLLSVLSLLQFIELSLHQFVVVTKNKTLREFGVIRNNLIVRKVKSNVATFRQGHVFKWSVSMGMSWLTMNKMRHQGRWDGTPLNPKRATNTCI